MATLPPVPFKVKAIAPYTPSSATELALVVGQIYEITNTDGKGVWVQSQVNGVVGWFPFNYTEVVKAEAPSVPTRAPSASLSKSGHTPTASADTEGSSSPRNGSALRKKPKKEKKNRPKKPGPPLRSHVEKNKKNHPVTVTIQIVRAKLSVPDAEVAKLEPTAFIFMRDVLGDEEGKKFESTNTMKKTSEPHFNEAFKMVVTDAEAQAVVIRFVNGKEYNKKKSLGEFQIILRGSHRGDFEGDGQYKWHYLCKDAIKDTPKKEGAPGKVLLYIQYQDTRETGKPTNFQRLGHIGWSASGGFDWSNIPPEWKEMFRQNGITRAALQSDQNLAKEVLDIMEHGSGGASSSGAPLPPAMPNGAGAGAGAPAPPPPPPAAMKKSAPPTPQVQDSYQQEEYQEEYQEEQPEESNSLLAAIRKGTSLRTVEVQERAAPVEEETSGGDLSGLLKKAMAGRLMAAGGDDDWSEEEPDDDDWD